MKPSVHLPVRKASHRSLLFASENAPLLAAKFAALQRDPRKEWPFVFHGKSPERHGAVASA
jgi:hypothetical protein